MGRLRAFIRRHAEAEDGAVMVLTAAVMIVLIGMAAFAVDLGWLYLNGSKTQKAAEAAALAGVVHMPHPSDVAFSSSDAYTTALDVASRQGFTNGVDGAIVTPEKTTDENQLRVVVTKPVPTFFMRAFGVDTVTLTRRATAEQVPPLKLGSDEPYLGTDPTIPGRNRFFWVSVNGEREPKENGDPFSTRCVSSGCSGTPNTQFRDPAYYYAVDVPAAAAGSNLTIQIYDGPHWRGSHSEFRGGDPLATGDRVGGNIDLQFRLLAPDQTPSDPTDNVPIAGCSRVYNTESDDSDPAQKAWSSLCSVTAVRGIYILELDIDGDGRAISDFSIRTLVDGNPSSSVAVYGLGAMSLDMVQAGVAPNFKIVKLEEFYAGNRLIISLFDAGDVSGGFANLTFEGELAPYECEVRVRSQDGTVIQDWGPDDSGGAAPCFFDTSGQRFNNQWLDFRWDIPDSYTCTTDCWVRVNYNFAAGASVTERTTWAARVDGQPIHLVP